jgi:hypothetical protein
VKGRGIAVLAVSALLAVAGIIGGCGSDSGTSAAAAEGSSAPLTKAQFLKQADEICRQGVKEKDQAVSVALKGQAAQAKGEAESQQIEKLVEEAVLPAYRKIVDQLSELSPPKRDEAAVKKIVGEYESALQATEADPAKAIKKNPFTETDEAASAYGMEACVL